jgi:predicted Zn-dependent peptidase
MRFSPKVYTLGNLRVVLVKEDRESVTVKAIVGTGSREESDKEAGSAHFLEHFVFKGTKEFPKMYDINTAVEKVGGAFNAYTGQHVMGFYVKMDKGHLDLATKIVGQIITEPILPKEHFDKERGTILEELNMYEDRPNSKAMEEMERILYGKTNLGRPIIGTVESLKEMTVEDLRNYYDKWFTAENIIVGVVGDYGSEEKILDLIKKEFAKLVKEEKKGLPEKNKFAWEKSSELKINLVTRKLSQAAVFVGFRGLPIADPLEDALEITNIILGDGWLSRLIKEVREERGWAYSIGSGMDQYTDVGDVVIGAGLPKEKLNDAVELIYKICTGLAGDNEYAITKEDLETAKETFRGRLALAFDKPEEVLGSALEDLMFEGRIYNPEEIMTKIEKVTLDQVREVSKKIFQRDNMVISVVGDYKDLDFKI